MVEIESWSTNCQFGEYAGGNADGLITIIIIITRPKPAYGRQGRAGVPLRASGAKLHHNIYIIIIIMTAVTFINTQLSCSAVPQYF